MAAMQGLHIALIGPDGCGKSAVARILSRQLAPPGKRSARVFHWRPGWLPGLWKLRGRAVPKPGELPKSRPGRLASLIRIIYYLTDYVLGYWVRVYPALRRGEVVIFDRYYYDYAVDPLSKNVALPATLVDLLGVIVPKPDYVFLLVVSADILVQRKAERQVAEIERQMLEFTTRGDQWRGFNVVGNEGPIEETVAKILRIIRANDMGGEEDNEA